MPRIVRDIQLLVNDDDDHLYGYRLSDGTEVRIGTSRPDNATAVVGVAIAGGAQAKRVGTRVMSTVPGIVTNQFDRTGLVAGRLAAPFEAIRLLFINGSANNCVNIKWAVSALPLGFDHTSRAAWNNNSGTWTSGTISTTAPASAANPTITATPWVELDGESACFSARVYIPSSGNTDATIAVNYKGNADAGGEAFASLSGDEWIMSSGTAGDHIANIAGMTSTANAAWGFIAGVQYRCKTGGVVTVMGGGDSIMHGTYGDIQGNSYWTKAVRALKQAGRRIEQANFGWSGQTTTTYSARMSYALPIIRPSLLIYSPFSPNDTAPTDATIAAQMTNAATVRSACRNLGVVYAPVTGTPYNYTAAEDALRKQLNDEVRGDVSGIDIDAYVATAQGYGTAATIKPAFTSDDIHLLDDGNEAASMAVTPILLAALASAGL